MKEFVVRDDSGFNYRLEAEDFSWKLESKIICFTVGEDNIAIFNAEKVVFISKANKVDADDADR